MSLTRFTVPWKVGKGIALKMPDSFSSLFSGVQENFALLMQDEKGQEFPVIYNAIRNEILIQGLINWLRDYEPKLADLIIIDLLDLKGEYGNAESLSVLGIQHVHGTKKVKRDF